MPKLFMRSCSALLALLLFTMPVSGMDGSRSQVQTVGVLPKAPLKLKGKVDYHVASSADPMPGGTIGLASPDAWLFLDGVRPSRAAETILSRLQVDGTDANLNTNVRFVQYGSGCVIIPQGPQFAAMTIYDRPDFEGTKSRLQCYVRYGGASSNSAVRSFKLKRGYMATLAQNANGTGASRNVVAQDFDLEVANLPAALDGNVHFIRVFPWRWVAKKGVAGDIFQNLNVGWYYDWNISHNSTPDLEYVPIKQTRYWPDLARQDWQKRGSDTLLGYNEPDHKDQSNLKVSDALAGWPELMETGLRLGSPAVSDGGVKWLFDFVDKADAANLRVDFVVAHYYRAVNNPDDAKGAADQLYRYVKEIHDHVHRPIWITEFNNGANWTGHEPTYEQEKAAIAAMIEMLDRTPFVERYAIYNWVEDVRNVQRKDGSLTAAGEVYRNERSPVSFVQP
jgi:hypothetical protein